MPISTLQSWLAVAGFCLLWGTSLYALIRKNAKKESDMYTAIRDVAVDVNRVGDRANAITASCSKHEDSITAIMLEQQASRDDRTTMRERIAGHAASLRALQDELQQERMAVMTTLHNNERAAAERDAKTREELARISERLDIERIVTSVVRNLRVS